MSIRSALKDPVVRVVLVIGLLPVAWFAIYWLAMIPVNHRYQMLSRVTETWKAAQDCQRAVEEYYGRMGRMPATEKDLACHTGSANVAAAKVASGVITISASGALREALEDGDSGTGLRLTPVCGGPCTGAPIASWDCVTGTTIERRYRPAICR
jgi:type IV pilus assembly protein PilA